MLCSRTGLLPLFGSFGRMLQLPRGETEALAAVGGTGTRVRGLTTPRPGAGRATGVWAQAGFALPVGSAPQGPGVSG